MRPLFCFVVKVHSTPLFCLICYNITVTLLHFGVAMTFWELRHSSGLMALSAGRRVFYVALIGIPLWAAIHWATLLP
jgi:hypothetical protein